MNFETQTHLLDLIAIIDPNATVLTINRREISVLTSAKQIPIVTAKVFASYGTLRFDLDLGFLSITIEA